MIAIRQYLASLLRRMAAAIDAADDADIPRGIGA